MQRWGIDVSRWQGDFDWKKAKSEGIEFAIVKCGGADDGYYTDKMFLKNCVNSAEAGVKIGAYYFGNARTPEEAVKEAEQCSKILDGHRFSYPIYYDVESSVMNVGKDVLDSIIKSFCETLENKGYYTGFYMNYNWYCNYCHGTELAKRFTAWIASWTKTCPATCDMWQFGGETNVIRSNKVAGVTVDQNYCYKDFPSEIQKKKLNGFDHAANSYSVKSNSTTFKIGDTVKITGKTYSDGTIIPQWVKNSVLYVRGVNDENIVVSTLKEGAVTGVVSKKDLVAI